MQGLFFFREVDQKLVDEVVISLGIYIFFIISFEKDLIEHIFFHLLQFEPIQYVKILENLVKVLTATKSPQVMNAGIKDHPVPDIGLQASADLPVLFQDAYFKPFLHQQVAAD